MSEQIRPAKGLAGDGRALWNEVIADCADQDLELDPRELRWLRSACELTDQAALVKAELDRSSVMLTGSQGQQVVHPALGEFRQLNLAISQTLGRIKVDEPAAAKSSGVNQPRSAAHTRWRGKGA